jgi:hypothetical protein
VCALCPEDPLLLQRWPPYLRSRIRLGSFKDRAAPTSIPAPHDFACAASGAVVYWVQGCVRTLDNGSLDFAKWLAAHRAVPLVAVCTVPADVLTDVVGGTGTEGGDMTGGLDVAPPLYQMVSTTAAYRRKSWLRLQELSAIRVQLAAIGVPLRGVVVEASGDRGASASTSTSTSTTSSGSGAESEAVQLAAALTAAAGDQGLLCVVTEHTYHPLRDAVTLQLSSALPGVGVVAVESAFLSEWMAPLLDSCDVSKSAAAYPGRATAPPPPTQEWSFLLPRITTDVEASLVRVLDAYRDSSGGVVSTETFESCAAGGEQLPPRALVGVHTDVLASWATDGDGSSVDGAALMDWTRIDMALSATAPRIFSAHTSVNADVDGIPWREWSETSALKWLGGFGGAFRKQSLSPNDLKRGLARASCYLRAGLLSARRVAGVAAGVASTSVFVALLDRVRDLEVARVLVAAAARNHALCPAQPVTARQGVRSNHATETGVSSSSSSSGGDENGHSHSHHPSLQVSWLGIIPKSLLDTLDTTCSVARPAASGAPVLLPLQFHLGRTADGIFNAIQHALVHLGTPPSAPPAAAPPD